MGDEKKNTNPENAPAPEGVRPEDVAPVDERSVEALHGAMNDLIGSVNAQNRVSVKTMEKYNALATEVKELKEKASNVEGMDKPETFEKLTAVETSLAEVRERMDRMGVEGQRPANQNRPQRPGQLRINADAMGDPWANLKARAGGEGSFHVSIKPEADFAGPAALAMNSWEHFANQYEGARYGAIETGAAPFPTIEQTDAGFLFTGAMNVFGLLPSLPWPDATELEGVRVLSFTAAGAAAVATTAISNASGIVTVTAPGHPFEVGQRAGITGVTPADYNGTYFVHAVNGDDFEIHIENASAGAVTVQGTVVDLNIRGADAMVAGDAAPGDSTIDREIFTLAAQNMKFVADSIPRSYLEDDKLLERHLEVAFSIARDFQAAGQFLYGTGTGNQWQGLLTHADKTINRTKSGETKIDTLRRGIAVAQFMGLFQGLTISVNPLEWADIELTKSATDDHYLLMNPKSVTGIDRFFAIPTQPIIRIASGEAMITSSNIGTVYWKKRSGGVEIFNQHGTNATAGLLTLMTWDRGNTKIDRPEGIIHTLF